MISFCLMLLVLTQISIQSPLLNPSEPDPFNYDISNPVKKPITLLWAQLIQESHDTFWTRGMFRLDLEGYDNINLTVIEKYTDGSIGECIFSVDLKKLICSLDLTDALFQKRIPVRRC